MLVLNKPVPLSHVSPLTRTQLWKWITRICVCFNCIIIRHTSFLCPFVVQQPVSVDLMDPLLVLLESHDLETQKAASLAISNLTLYGPGKWEWPMTFDLPQKAASLAISNLTLYGPGSESDLSCLTSLRKLPHWPSVTSVFMGLVSESDLWHLTSLRKLPHWPSVTSPFMGLVVRVTFDIWPPSENCLIGHQ